MVDDRAVVLLVLYTPGRQALDGFHGVGHRLEFSIQRGLQGPGGRGRRGGGLTAASAAAGRHLPGLHKRPLVLWRRRRRRERAKQSVRVRESRGREGGQGVGMLHALGSPGGRTSSGARGRPPRAPRRGCGGPGLSVGFGSRA